VFTGLVLCRGRIAARRRGSEDCSLSIEAAGDLGEPLAIGESVSVSGACLTVEKVSSPRAFSVFASHETLRLTTLGRKDAVNLERALRLSDRLGGHLVSGHVDGLGRLERVSPAGRSLSMAFSFPPELAPYIVPKGSIAIDGVSLTVNEADLRRFTVNLIPKTAELTTLADLKPGREVNLETDIVGRHIRRLLETGVVPGLSPRPSLEASPGLDLEALARMGY
jgi:riboflavin synthase